MNSKHTKAEKKNSRHELAYEMTAMQWTAVAWSSKATTTTTTMTATTIVKKAMFIFHFGFVSCAPTQPTHSYRFISTCAQRTVFFKKEEIILFILSYFYVSYCFGFGFGFGLTLDWVLVRRVRNGWFHMRSGIVDLFDSFSHRCSATIVRLFYARIHVFALTLNQQKTKKKKTIERGVAT